MYKFVIINGEKIDISELRHKKLINYEKEIGDGIYR